MGYSWAVPPSCPCSRLPQPLWCCRGGIVLLRDAWGCRGIWGPLSCGVGARGTRKAPFQGAAEPGAKGAAARAWGSAGVCPTHKGGGGPLPGTSHGLCNTHVPQVLGDAWCLVGQSWSQLWAVCSAEHGGRTGLCKGCQGWGGSAVYRRQQWGEPRCPSPSGG